VKEEASAQAAAQESSDVTDLAAMLKSRWKSGAGSVAKEGMRAGQIRRFKITALDLAGRKVDVEPAD
jgi:hypothetical protein